MQSKKNHVSQLGANKTKQRKDAGETVDPFVCCKAWRGGNLHNQIKPMYS